MISSRSQVLSISPLQDISLCFSWIFSWPQDGCHYAYPQMQTARSRGSKWFVSSCVSLVINREHFPWAPSIFCISLSGEEGAGRNSNLVGNKKFLTQIGVQHTKHGWAFPGETGLLMCLIIGNIWLQPFPTFTKGWSNFFFGNENQGEKGYSQTMNFRWYLWWFLNGGSVRVSSEVYYP